MSTSEWSRELAVLRRAGVELEPGLTEAEIRAAEQCVGAPFPPDLRSFLATAMPAGERFPDWRRPDAPELADQLQWPREGIEFDVEHNVFWWPAWGTRPPVLGDALAVARARLAEVPRLIPVYGHRYLPAEPHAAGNPVLSVYQTDIIYYGSDLRTYLAVEFHRGLEPEDFQRLAREKEPEPRYVRFWSDVIGEACEPPAE